MKQLVKLMDDVNGEVLPPIKFFLKTYTKNLTSPCFYLFPKYNAALAYLGFLIIYTYIDIGVFILGFFMGKIIVKRSIDISFLLCLIYALISFGLMLLIGSLKYVFYDYMYSNFTFTFSIFIESLGDRDSLFVSIGTLISFFIGEIVEYINNKSNS